MSVGYSSSVIWIPQKKFICPSGKLRIEIARYQNPPAHAGYRTLLSLHEANSFYFKQYFTSLLWYFVLYQGVLKINLILFLYISASVSSIFFSEHPGVDHCSAEVWGPRWPLPDAWPVWSTLTDWCFARFVCYARPVLHNKRCYKIILFWGIDRM